MTVRNCLLWASVAMMASACSLKFDAIPPSDVDVVAIPGEPVSLSRAGRGVQKELPPVPRERRAAVANMPPLPAVRPQHVADAAKPDGSAADGDTRPRMADSGADSTPSLDDDAAAMAEPIDEPLFEPKKFFGMSADGVRTLLGPPQMVFERPPSTVWHYRDGTCELDLYFYLDVASGKFRVATFDLSPHRDDANQRPTTRCLKRLRIAYNAS